MPERRRSLNRLKNDFIDLVATTCTECVKPEKWPVFKWQMGRAFELYAEYQRRQALETAADEIKALLKKLP